MVEGYEDGGDGSLISLRKMLGEVLQEDIFIFDLEMMTVSLEPTNGNGGVEMYSQSRWSLPLQ